MKDSKYACVCVSLLLSNKVRKRERERTTVQISEQVTYDDNVSSALKVFAKNEKERERDIFQSEIKHFSFLFNTTDV